MTGDGYTFDPEAARRVEKGLRQAIAELNELGFDIEAQQGRGFSDLQMTHMESGHPGLQSTFEKFCERWGWGVRGHIQDANGIAKGLGLSAGMYHEQEQYASDTLKNVVSVGMGNPMLTEEQVTSRSWSETLQDNNLSHISNAEYELPSTEELKQPWDQVGDDWSTSPLSPGLGQDTDWQWDGGEAAQQPESGEAEGDGGEELMGLGDISEGINTIVGEGVEWAGDKAADGLEKIGADGAAGAVRDGSEWAADELGAQVGERRLGETDDPKELVHGDAGALKKRAAHLKDFSAAFDRLGTGMRGMDAGSWKGEAGDAFRARFEVQPKFWIRAADACETADKALSTYAETVTWAQGQAKEAIAAFAKAVQASEQAVAAHNAKVDTWNSDNAAGRDPGPKPGPFHDPGEEGLKHARHLLKEARKQRNEAAEDARQALSTALEHAPAEPSVGTELTATFKDGWKRGNLVGTHLLGGLANGAAGAYRLVRRFNVLDPYNLTHPGEYVRNLNMTLRGFRRRPPTRSASRPWSSTRTGATRETRSAASPSTSSGPRAPAASPRPDSKPERRAAPGRG